MNESDVEAAMQAATAFRMQNARGAVGSNEAPPNPWKGISGPPGGPTSVAPRDVEGWLVLVDSMSEKNDELFTRIAALEADNVSLTEELGTAHRAIAWLERKLAASTAFTDDPPDLPDPPRRPDGTLMPQPKALTVPRETGDKRRIGG